MQQTLVSMPVTHSHGKGVGGISLWIAWQL
jgi:hypothetical protein